MTQTDRSNQRRKRRWRLVGGLIILALVVNLAVNPAMARRRSLIVMSGYDWWFERSSVAQSTGVRVDMPLADAGLYPRMITFNADEAMSAWLDADVRFTVDFSFGDFAPRQGYARFFDPADELHGAYVGTYYLQGLGRPATAREVELIAEFDQRVLALPALGLATSDASFEVTEHGSPTIVEYADHQWTSHDARLATNCPDHNADGFLPAYLQFGTPPAADSDYPVCEQFARIEVSYLPDADLTVGLFIMAAAPETVELLSNQVVRRAQLVS